VRIEPNHAFTGAAPHATPKASTAFAELLGAPRPPERDPALIGERGAGAFAPDRVAPPSDVDAARAPATPARADVSFLAGRVSDAPGPDNGSAPSPESPAAGAKARDQADLSMTAAAPTPAASTEGLVDAYAFGAFGVFAPVRVGADPSAATISAAASAVAPAEGFDAASQRPAASAALESARPAGSPPAGSAELPASPTRGGPTPMRRAPVSLQAGEPPPLSEPMEPAGEPPAEGAAPALPPEPAPRRSDGPRLVVAVRNGALAIVAGTPDLADEAEARARLAAVAAEHGVGLDELIINGRAGAPAREGARHGHRTR
jgi:hypothetical protein